MARKVFTYKDVEEAKRYIGKPGVFGDNLARVSRGDVQCPDVRRGVLLFADDDRPTYPFESEKAPARNQFFSPDPEPVEKWVPFTAEDWELFMGKPVKMKGWDAPLIASSLIVFCNDGVVTTGNGDVDYDELLSRWTFMDGTPCGKKSLTESPE